MPTSRDQLLNELPSNVPLLAFFQIEWNISICEGHEQCMNTLNEMIELFPNSTWVHSQLGEIYAVARLPLQVRFFFLKINFLFSLLSIDPILFLVLILQSDLENYLFLKFIL